MLTMVPAVFMQGGASLRRPGIDDTSVMNFTELPGTVCLFGGKYYVNGIVDIPTVSCGVPAIPSTGNDVKHYNNYYACETSDLLYVE